LTLLVFLSIYFLEINKYYCNQQKNKMMKKLFIPLLALTCTLLFACNNQGAETETQEETVSDVIEQDTAIQNELDNANKELEEMMKADEAAETK